MRNGLSQGPTKEKERNSQKPINSPMIAGRIAWSAPVVWLRGLASKSQ